MILLALSVLISISIFWTSNLLPGFDTPFYLTEIRNFASQFPNPLNYPYLDRYLTIAFPSLISKLLSVDPVISYKISISIIYCLISFTLYRLFKNISKNTIVALLFGSAISISPFLISYATMLYANLAGFLILFIYLAIDTNKNFINKNISLGIIFGTLFYVHNFSSFSLGLIIISYQVLNFFLNYKETWKKTLIINCVALIIGSFGIIRYFSVKINSINSAIVSTPTMPVILGNEKKRIVDALIQHSGKYWLLFFILFFVFSVIFLRKEINAHRRKFLLPLAIFIPSIIFSFQPYYNLNYLPERFVTLVVLSSYFFYLSIIKIPKLKKYLIPLAVIPLILNYLSADNLILNKGYRSYSTTEISFYGEIESVISKNSTILTSSDHEYWGRYFLKDYKILSGESFISCGIVKEPGYFGDINFFIAKLLSENDPNNALIYLNKIKAFIPFDKIYILVDNQLSCSSGKSLKDAPFVRAIIKKGQWTLYETK